MTNTSLLRNRELGILLTDPDLVETLQSVFTNDFTGQGNSVPAEACLGGPCATIRCPPPS